MGIYQIPRGTTAVQGTPMGRINNIDNRVSYLEKHGTAAVGPAGAIQYTNGSGSFEGDNLVTRDSSGNLFASTFFLDPVNIVGLQAGFIYDSSGLPIIDFGLNAAQFGNQDPSYNGSIFRLDSRGNYAFFNVLYQPPPNIANDELVPFQIINPNGDIMPSVIIGAPGDGDNIGTGFGENLQVFNNASIGAQINNSGGTDLTPVILGILGVGMTNAQYSIDVYDRKGTGVDIGNSTSGLWKINFDGSMVLANFDFIVDNGGNVNCADLISAFVNTQGMSILGLTTLSNDGSAVFAGGGFIIQSTGDIVATQTYTTDGNLIIDATGSLHTSAPLYDSTGSIGTPGQVLLSNGSADIWAYGAGVVAKGDLLAKTTAQSTVMTGYNTPNDSTVHTFRVNAYTAITAISAGTLTVQVSFTDENGTARTISYFPMGLTSAGLTSTGFDSFPPTVIRCSPNTAITLKTTFTGVSITYDVGGYAEFIY